MLNSNYSTGFGASSDDQDLNKDESPYAKATEDEEDLEEELDRPGFTDIAADDDEEDVDENEEELMEDEEDAESADEEDELSFVPSDVSAKDQKENTSPIFGSIMANAMAPDDDEEAAEEEAEEDDADDFEIEDSDEGDDEENEVKKEAPEEAIDDDNVIISKSKIILVNRLLRNIQENTDRLSYLLGNIDNNDLAEEQAVIAEVGGGSVSQEEDSDSVIEGVFNGENMIGPDGHEYAVPANYASKSKLVEGDMLKLTISDRGTFRYKQTKPVERKRIIGKLEKDIEGNYLVKAEHKRFRVIAASITYYKGIPGDKVVVLVPVAGDSSWAAVENVIKA